MTVKITFPRQQAVSYGSCQLYKIENMPRCRLDSGNLNRRRAFLLENNIVVLDEDVTQNGELKTTVTESSNASVVLVLEDQVGSRDLVAVSANAEGKILQGGGVAGDGVGSVTIVGSVQCFSDLASLGVGEQQEGGSSVNDSRESIYRAASNCGRVNGDTPETLRVVDGDGSKSTSELGIINTTKEVFTATAVGFLAKEDTKDGLRDQTLRNEVVNGSLDARDANNAVKGKTQETISRVRGEFRRDVLGKLNYLTLDGKASNGDIVSSADTRRRGTVTI